MGNEDQNLATVTAESPRPALDTSMTFDEALSILRTVLPRGSFKFEITAWAHRHQFTDDDENEVDGLDICIKVWCHDMMKGFEGNTLAEATLKCRDAIAARLKEDKDDDERDAAKRAQLASAVADAERSTLQREKTGDNNAGLEGEVK